MAFAAMDGDIVQNDIFQTGKREGGILWRIGRRRDDEAWTACVTDIAIRRAALREKILLLDGSLVDDDGSGDGNVGRQCLETIGVVAFLAVVVSIQREIVCRIFRQFDDGSGGALLIVDEWERHGVMPFCFRSLFVAQCRLELSFILGLQIVKIDGADRVARDDFKIRLFFNGDWIIAFKKLWIRHDGLYAVIGWPGGGSEEKLEGIRVPCIKLDGEMLAAWRVFGGADALQFLAVFVKLDLQIGDGRAAGGDVRAKCKYRMLRQFLHYGVVVGIPCVVADDFA